MEHHVLTWCELESFRLMSVDLCQSMYQLRVWPILYKDRFINGWKSYIQNLCL